VDLLGWLEASTLAAFLRQNIVCYILVNAGHILGIGLLVGAILPLDLRIVGLLRGGRIEEIAPFLVRAAAAGLVLAGVTGLMLFSVKPAEYAGNPAFLTKLCLIAFGLIIVTLQHGAASWGSDVARGRPSRAMRALALLSAATWLSVLIAGRWIGFV
jgi:hypothetical protein